MPLFMMAMMSRGSFTPTGAGEAKNDGYFDINIVTLNVSGFALNSGTFWDDISVVFAHPNDGKAVPFKDIERGLDCKNHPHHSLLTRLKQTALKVSVQRLRG